MGYRLSSKELCDLLRDSGLINGQAAAGAIPSNNGNLSFSRADTASIKHTYSIRSKTLKLKRSDHAMQLRQAIDELLREIEVRKVTRVVTTEIPADPVGTYFVFLDSEEDRPIGCFYAIAQQELSPSKWKELWGEL